MRVYSLNSSALHQKRKTKFMSIDMPQCNWFAAYEIDCIKQQFNYRQDILEDECVAVQYIHS